MPRYFFSTLDGGHDIDHEGVELSGPAAARVAAVAYAGDMLGDQPDLLQEGGCFSVDVAGEGGQPLFSVVTRVEDRAG